MNQRAQAIIICNDEILFGYRNLGKKDYRHFFIGGATEDGESPEQAVIREVKEETDAKGKIIFKFRKECEENHFTFLIEVDRNECKLGFDPEEASLPAEERTLQGLMWIPLRDKENFTEIDRAYLKLLYDECKERRYNTSWVDLLRKLIEDK